MHVKIEQLNHVLGDMKNSRGACAHSRIQNTLFFYMVSEP